MMAKRRSRTQKLARSKRFCDQDPWHIPEAAVTFRFLLIFLIKYCLLCIIWTLQEKRQWLFIILWASGHFLLSDEWFFSCFDDLTGYALGQSTNKVIINLYVWWQMSVCITISAVLNEQSTCILKKHFLYWRWQCKISIWEK